MIMTNYSLRLDLEENFCGNQKAHHCYPLNMNFNDPNIQGIESILQCYRNILNQTNYMDQLISMKLLIMLFPL